LRFAQVLEALEAVANRPAARVMATERSQIVEPDVPQIASGHIVDGLHELRRVQVSLK
jgi:hypothetical protein